MPRPTRRLDWNTVATVSDGRRYSRARSLLREFGAAGTTGFMDVLVLRSDEDPHRLLERFRERAERDPEAAGSISRLVPVSTTFVFQSQAEFETRTREAIAPLVGRFAGRSFHLRMHRRGFKGRISSAGEERELAGFILDSLARDGKSATVRFDDPDLVLDIETVGQRAGIALWTRDELKRFPFLKAA